MVSQLGRFGFGDGVSQRGVLQLDRLQNLSWFRNYVT